jgi:hypothetical protein
MIALASGFLGCAREKVHRGEKAMPPTTIQEVLKTHTPELMSIPGVVGTALGEQKGELCIKVLVVQKTPELTQKIPSTLEGFPVVIQQTGEIRALDMR